MKTNLGVVVEKETSDDRIDCVIETPLYIYILEFNLNGSVKAAFQQIKDRNYVASYATDSWNGICIYVNFSSATGAVMGKKWDCILLN